MQVPLVWVRCIRYVEETFADYRKGTSKKTLQIDGKIAHNGLEFEEVGDEYVEMFEEIHSDTDNRIKKDEFYNNIANSFMTSDSNKWLYYI